MPGGAAPPAQHSMAGAVPIAPSLSSLSGNDFEAPGGDQFAPRAAGYSPQLQHTQLGSDGQKPRCARTDGLLLTAAVSRCLLQDKAGFILRSHCTANRPMKNRYPASLPLDPKGSRANFGQQNSTGSFQTVKISLLSACRNHRAGANLLECAQESLLGLGHVGTWSGR